MNIMTLKPWNKQLLYKALAHTGRLIQFTTRLHKPLHLFPKPCILSANVYPLLTFLPANPPQAFTLLQVK